MSDKIYEAGKKMLCGDYSQYTPTGASYFKKHGNWIKLPSVGAIQYNYLKSQHRIAHVGVVVECSIDHKNRVFTVTTIEGNTSAKTWERNGGQVAKKVYENVPFDSVGTGTDNHIEGFGVPRFSTDTCGISEFLEVLNGEVGYIEKASNSSLGDIYNKATEEEKVQNKGVNNYTKYGEWYGQNGVAWCQQFISWCAWKACKLYNDKKNRGWVKKDGYWYYYSSKDIFLKGTWLYDDGRWYVFDKAGRMITGWFNGDGIWYYLAKDGAMCENQWIETEGSWYYIGKDGVMATNCYVKDLKGWCYLDEDGAWNGEYADKLEPGFEVI